MGTKIGKCVKCGRDFEYEAPSNRGSRREYCDGCFVTRRDRSIKRHIQALLTEIRDSQRRTNEILDRIEARPGGTPR